LTQKRRYPGKKKKYAQADDDLSRFAARIANTILSFDIVAMQLVVAIINEEKLFGNPVTRP